jgi:hypothetical protein
MYPPGFPPYRVVTSRTSRALTTWMCVLRYICASVQRSAHLLLFREKELKKMRGINF